MAKLTRDEFQARLLEQHSAIPHDVHKHCYDTVVVWKTTRDYAYEAAAESYPYIRETKASRVMCSSCGDIKPVVIP